MHSKSTNLLCVSIGTVTLFKLQMNFGLTSNGLSAGQSLGKVRNAFQEKCRFVKKFNNHSRARNLW